MTVVKRTLVAASCVLPFLFAANATALTLTQVSAEPRYSDKAENITVRFKLSEPATVKLFIYDARDVLVKRHEKQIEVGGDHAISWNKRSNAGTLVPAGAYHYVIQAEGLSGSSVVHDLTDSTGGESLTPPKAEWKPEEKRIHYRVTKPARVNIRVGLNNGGPLLNTVAGWVARSPGEKSQAWDGYDKSAALDISAHPELQISISAFSLSDNSVIVGAQSNSRIELVEPVKQPLLRPKTASSVTPRMHDYASQSFAERGDFPVRLVLPEGLARTANGLPIITGESIPVRLEVPEPYRLTVQAERYEPVFFVDGTFAFENEVGFLPMTWRWSTQGLGPGEHYLTANLRGYNGNFGMATVKVILQPE